MSADVSVEKALRLAVISDDVAAFGTLIGQNADLKRLCYGRFPLESLLILYGAKKILRTFRPSTEDYVFVEEYPADYLRFKREAGAALRLYIGGKTVPPDEMALICGMRVPESAFAENGERLNEVYRLRARKNLKKDGSGKYRAPVSRKPDKRQLYTVVCCLITAIIFLGAASGLMGFVATSYGDGSAMAPALVNTADKLTGTISQNPGAHIEITSDFTLNISSDYSLPFSGYIDGGGHTLTMTGDYYLDPFAEAAALGRVDNLTLQYADFHSVYSGSVRRIVLDNDVTLSANSVNGISLTSSFDGAGHTVTVTDFSGKSLFDELNAYIKNVTFDFGKIRSSYTANGGFLANVNNSRIENVTVIASGYMEELSAGTDVYFGGFVYENRGTVSSVTASIQLELISDFSINGSQGNSYFSGIAGINSGTVSNAATTEDSFIESTTLDVSGIVSDNSSGAVIENSVNRASISTASASVMWSPNAAGVVLNNYGTVRDCFNYGAITADSTAPVSETDTSRPAVYLGGIAAQNAASVLRCYNGADLSSTSVGALPFVGGIVGLNTCSAGESAITSCIAHGAIEVNTELETGNFLSGIGGIAGMLQPLGGSKITLTDSFSLMTLNANNSSLSVGGILGSLDSRQGYYGYGFSGDAGECLFAENRGAEFGIAYVLYYDMLGILRLGVYEPGAAPAEEITAKESYWYEE